MKPVSTGRIIKVSFIVNVIDVVTNMTVVILTGSAIIFSEMLQGVADLTGSAFLLLGMRAALKPTDSDHPFGHGKEAFFWSLMSTIFLFFTTATLSIVRGAYGLTNPEEIRHIYLAFGVVTLGLITNGYSLQLSVNKLRQKGKSFIRSYLASSRTSVKNTFVSDFAGTLAALLGMVALILYQVTGNLIFDGLGAIMVGVLLAVLSGILFWQIKDYLVGRAAPDPLEEAIRHAAKSVPGVVDVVAMRTMYVGTNDLLAEIQVNILDELKTDDVEVVIDRIKEKIRERVPEVKHLQIEAESPRFKLEEEMTIVSEKGESKKGKPRSQG